MAGLFDMLGAGGVNPGLMRLLAGAPGPMPLFGAPTGPTQQPIGLDTAGTMAPPQVSVPVPQPPAPAPSGFQNLLSALMPQTNPLAGLLASPEDISNARGQGFLDIGTSLLDSAGPHFRYQAPSLGQAVAHGLEAGRQGFQQALGGAVQQRMEIPQLMYQVQQMQALNRVRQEAEANPLPAGASPADAMMYFAKLASDYGAVDPQMAASFAGPMSALRDILIPKTVSTGKDVTQFVPGMGFINPKFDANKPESSNNPRFVPTLAQGENLDTIKQQAIQNQLAAAGLGIRDQQLGQTVITNFQGRVQGELKAADAARTLKADIAAARAGDPVASENVLIGLPSLSDPRAQIRQGMVEIMLTPNKSIKMKLDQLKVMASSGKLPPELLDQIGQLVDSNLKAQASSYSRKYRETSAQNPRFAPFLQSPEAAFGISVPSPADWAQAAKDPGYAAYLKSQGWQQ